MEKMTVVELRKELRSLGKSSKGLKAELIERLKECKKEECAQKQTDSDLELERVYVIEGTGEEDLDREQDEEMDRYMETRREEVLEKGRAFLARMRENSKTRKKRKSPP